MPRLTIKDIAKALNVSTSTVSKALSNSYEISEKTKQRILDYAQKEGYTPSRSAKNLRTGKSNTVGVIVSSLSNTFFSQVLQSIQSNFEKKGIYTIIMQSGFDEDSERKCIESMMKREVDGLLISPVKADSNLELLQNFQKERPVILFDRTESALKSYKIGIDNEEASFKATHHLLRKGNKNIGIILGKGLGISESRFEGYKRALSEYRLPIKDKNIHYLNLGDFQVLDQKISRFINKHMKSSKPIDAIVCGTETISTRSLGVLNKLNVKVPEELSVVGFANTPLAFFLNPPMTTILQPTEKLGYLSTQKMFTLLKKSPPFTQKSKRIILDAELIVRESSTFS